MSSWLYAFDYDAYDGDAGAGVRATGGAGGDCLRANRRDRSALLPLVHPHFGTGEYCHVLSSDRDLLIEFGAAYGFPLHLLQPPRRGRGVWHFDAFGWRAIALRRLATKLTGDESGLNRRDAEREER